MNKRIRKKKGLLKIKEEELWNLDCTIIKFVLPRLKAFKQMKNGGLHGHPSSLKNMQ